MSEQQLIEDASDPFECFPSRLDAEILDQGFLAARQIYLAAARYPRSAEHVPALASAETLASLSFFGDGGAAIYGYYVNKGLSDPAHFRHPPTAQDGRVEYEPWYDVGLLLPYDAVDVAFGPDEGLDTIRCGDLGPMPFVFSGDVPDIVHTVVIRRSLDRKSYETVFLGHSFVSDEAEAASSPGVPHGSGH